LQSHGKALEKDIIIIIIFVVVVVAAAAVVAANIIIIKKANVIFTSAQLQRSYNIRWRSWP